MNSAATTDKNQSKTTWQAAEKGLDVGRHIRSRSVPAKEGDLVETVKKRHRGGTPRLRGLAGSKGAGLIMFNATNRDRTSLK